MLQELAEQGITPKALEERPELEEHLICPWQIYSHLSRERPPSFSGLARIPLSSFLTYADLYQFTRLDSQENWKLVRFLDATYVDFYEKRQAAQAATEKRKAKKA